MSLITASSLSGDPSETDDCSLLDIDIEPWPGVSNIFNAALEWLSFLRGFNRPKTNWRYTLFHIFLGKKNVLCTNLLLKPTWQLMSYCQLEGHNCKLSFKNANHCSNSPVTPNSNHKFPIKLWYLHTHFCDMSILHEQTVRNLRCKFTNAEEEGLEYTQMWILMFIEHSKMDDWSFCWPGLSNN